MTHLKLKILIVAMTTTLAYSEPPIQGLRAPYLPPSTNYGTPDYSGYPDFNSGYADTGYDASYESDGQHRHGHENEVPKAYSFGYSVKDAQSGNDYDRHETSDGDTVRGEYRVQLPDGRTQIVTYHADWRTGFHADVRYEGEARYPEPSHTQGQQGGYNYEAPADYRGSLTGFDGYHKK